MKWYVKAFALIIPILIIVVGVILVYYGADRGGCEECNGHPCYCYDKEINYPLLIAGTLVFILGGYIMIIILLKE
jgi:hypothetical protein